MVIYTAEGNERSPNRINFILGTNFFNMTLNIALITHLKE